VILVIDTATSQAVIGLTGPEEPDDGLASRSWPVRHQHGETLLPTLVDFLAERGGHVADLRGIIVGTGPGAFTGLRVGLATAKGLAHGLDLPIVGVSTGEALIDAVATSGTPGGDAGTGILLLLPAGPNDRVAVRRGDPPELLPGGVDPVVRPGDRLVAVDLEGRAPAEAVALGTAAHAGLASALWRIGSARLAAGRGDDLAGLVPEYVTLPRGIRASTGEMTWSRDHR
jgi:tRNA threonylcarbamoyladenosine biosynthesis protein TsaB